VIYIFNWKLKAERVLASDIKNLIWWGDGGGEGRNDPNNV
jgi:hypothetical protein